MQPIADILNPTCFLTFLVLAVAGWLALEFLFHTESNCGGNSAALADCRSYARLAINPESDTSLPFAHLDRALVAQALSNRWGRKTFHVRIAASSAGTRTVVVVCDRLFNNVPQPTVWNLFRKTPRHAVGYSDGSIGLIDDQAYWNLDFGNFVGINPEKFTVVRR